jgi:hypothetical protein
MKNLFKINVIYKQVAQSSVSVLMIDELTDGLTSINSIKTAIESGVGEALTMLNNAGEEAQAKVSNLFGLEKSIPI